MIPLIGISTPSVCCLFFLWFHFGDSIDRDINTLCLLFFFFCGFILVIPLIGISTPSVCCLFFLWFHFGDSIDRDINTLCLLFVFFVVSCW